MPLKRLKDTEPFNHLPDAIFNEIRESAIEKKFPPHTYIFRKNDPPTGYLYVIKDGMVEITVPTPGGGEIIVDYRKEGSFFGGTPVFNGEPYTGGARTVKETECYLLPDEVLKKAEDEVPQFGAFFTRIMISRVRHLYAEIVSEHGNAMTQVEAFPFKKRLSEIMSTPVEWCSPQTSVREAAAHFSHQKINSLVVLDENRNLTGIITGRDLISKVIVPENIDPSAITAGEIMTPNPITLPADTYMYEAMAYMTSQQIKHLPVVDREEVVGMVALTDLLHHRSQKAMLLVGGVREATRLSELANIHRQLVDISANLLAETRSAPEVMGILSHIHHNILRRTFDLVMEEMKQKGLEPPDVRYCFLIMGSGGRREMLLQPDQDNGFIYENVPDERLPELERFFGPFSERLVHALDTVGYPLCEGNVMASNPVWRGRLKDWEARILNWAENPEPHQVRYSSIFLDFAPLTGDSTLAHDLLDIVHKIVAEHPGFLYHVMSLNLTHKVPTGLWGRFTLEKSGPHKGQLSLKKGGLIYIVDCIRMFTLEQGVKAHGTLERLEALVDHNVLAPETAEHIRIAFEALSYLRLRNEIGRVQQDLSPTHYLNPYDLTKTEQDVLRESFHAVSKLQEATKSHFGKGIA